MGACHERKESKESVVKIIATWQNLNIRSNLEEYSVAYNVNSLIIRFTPNGINKKDSLLEFKITKAEKDSLFKWSEQIIDRKESPALYCTDYYGKLGNKIIYRDQLSKYVEYTSMCEWYKLDENSLKIYEFITALKGKK